LEVAEVVASFVSQVVTAAVELSVGRKLGASRTPGRELALGKKRLKEMF
jgi:hypothetical protein